MLSRRRAIVSANPPRMLGELTTNEKAAIGAAVGIATAGVVVLSVAALGIWALASMQRGDVSRVIVTPYRPRIFNYDATPRLGKKKGPRWWRWR